MEKFSLVMLGDSGTSLGIPTDFRGKLFAYTKEPRRNWEINVEDGRVRVSEHFYQSAEGDDAIV